MVKIKYIPARGDIVWINFDPIKGHEQSGRRPAIVISPERYNLMSGRALFCPVTSKIKGHVFDVLINGNDIKGSILTDQIRTLDFNKRNIIFIEKSSISIIDEVESKLLTLIRV